jgi:alkylation response protein AidB-like acyl-CoA dehydrogenase
MAHPIFTEEHDLIRAQLRRFVEEKVKPDGPKWEAAGFVPREILREMGGLGFFALRVPEALGGSASMPALRSCSRKRSAVRRTAASPSPCWSIPTWRART